MQVKDLLLGVPSGLPGLADAENPFVDALALVDTQVTRVVVDVLGGTVGILLELRQAPRLRGTTGLLRVAGVVRQEWTGSAAANRFTGWTITDAVIERDLTEIRIDLHCLPAGSLHVTGSTADFVLLAARPDLTPPPPNDPEALRRFGEVDESAAADPLAAAHLRTSAPFPRR
ncbi:hypothetical protein [Microbacterium paraoxydans]|uniref:hypothetical protein n=1 Tax=Microbacterium paraoxydans TaxID=199592 RepID=UPI003D720BAF